jgi:hypothetical protein
MTEIRGPGGWEPPLSSLRKADPPQEDDPSAGASAHDGDAKIASVDRLHPDPAEAHVV